MISEALVQTKISNFKDENDSNNLLHDEDVNIILSSVPSERPIHLDLSFQRIEKIGNLNGFGKIVSLVLNNNKIKEIRGLEKLIHLKRLDLSFNEIEKIEGLSTLMDLEDLSLYHNQIERISGLEKCFRMKSLSLGLNRLTDIENVLSGIYHMKNLKDLVLSSNPIVEEHEEKFRFMILSQLQQLKYLDDLKVTQEEIFEARTTENAETNAANNEVTPNHNDLTHPLEIIVATFVDRVEHDDDSKDLSALHQCWSIINDYTRNSLELKDEFSHRLGAIRDEMKTRIRHTVEDLVRQKNELIYLETGQQEKQKQIFNIMDQEIYLSRQNQNAIDVIKETFAKKYMKSKEEVQQKTIASLMDVMQSSFLRRIRMASEKNDGDSTFNSIEKFETDIKTELKRLDQEDEESVHIEINKLLLDLEVKHNIRVCQIVDVLKQLN